MSENLDLLGDPIPDGFGRRGRPVHRTTDEKRRVVIQLQAFGWSHEKIAAALSITPPTLRKNYFRELRAKVEARARVEAVLLEALMTKAMTGDASAIDKYFKRLDRYDQKETERIAIPGARQQAVGKKERRRQAAAGVEGMYAPPLAPKESVN